MKHAIANLQRFRSTRRLLFPVLVAVIAILVVSVAVAAAVQFTLSVPSSGNIVPYNPTGGTPPGTGTTSYAIAVYSVASASDVSTTTRLKNTASPGVAYGNITQGDATGVTKYFYVVNIGNQPVRVSADVKGLPEGVTYTATVASGESTVAVGQGTHIAITLTALGTAPTGSFSNTITHFYSGN